MKKAIVTGANGQLFSYVCEYLIQLNYEVFGMKRRSSTNNTSNLKDILYHPHFHLVEGDVTDLGCLINLIHNVKPDEFYNGAAQSHVKTSFSQPGLTFDITGKGVLNCLEAIKLTKPDTKFLQATSSECFGDQYDIVNGVKCQNENTKMNPQSPYAIAKLNGYHLTKLYRESYGIFASNAIFFNNESPRRGELFVTKKITTYINNLTKYQSLSDTPKLPLGNLNACRDWGYSKEYAEGAVKILQHNEPDDFVIGTGQSHSVREFLEEAFKFKGVDYNNFVTIEPTLFRPSEVDYLRADNTKIKTILKWSPKTTFNELIKIMIENR